MDEKVKKLQEMIDNSKKIVFFGGAGVSTESNIPDFRSADGIYHQSYRYKPEEVVSHSFFYRHTEAFYEFYRDKMLILDAKPNPAHQKLAEMEKKNKLSAVITQNIDGLHQAAGSQNVLELHGSVHRNYCVKCGKKYDASFIKKSNGIPRCEVCGELVKPDVVLYEESLDELTIRKSIDAIASCDMLIVGGTSLAVYPAAGFLDYFNGKYLVVINKSEMRKELKADLVINDAIGKVLSQITV